MLSKRLEAIISLVDKNDKIIDIGTDHAYVPIALYKRNIANKIVASDISNKVCINAKKNIELYGIKDINVVCSDGFNNINEHFDLAILSGMGTKTILKILQAKNVPDKLIIASQNDFSVLRNEMNKKGYKISNEIVVFDKKYYPILKYEKGKENLTIGEILFGKSNNIDYYQYLIKKYKVLYNKSKNEKFLEYQNLLLSIIEKRQD